MRQSSYFLEAQFSVQKIPVKWESEGWTSLHCWIYTISDIIIWVSFFVLSYYIIQFIRKKSDLPLGNVFWLFGTLILITGLNYLIDAILFWQSGGKIVVLFRFTAAILSIVTVVAAFKFFPVAMKLKTPVQFDILEHMINERTAELKQALENEKSATEQLLKNQTKLELLKDISSTLSSSLNYCDILVSLSNMVTPTFADWCAIDELTGDGSLRRLVVSHTNKDKIKQAYELADKYPPIPESPHGIYNVIRTHEPELYHQITDETIESFANSKEHIKLLREVGMKSAIILPLFIRENAFGVLTLVSVESERLFDETDLEFAKEIARQAMLAIENAKLYEASQEVNAELEYHVTQRTQELENINKELEAFSYSVSHDLRAPLRSIDGFSNKIMKDYYHLLDTQGRDYFMRVKKASQHMGQLIDDMLKLSRLSRVEMHREVVDLSIIANAIAVELQSTNPERQLKFVIHKELYANADANLIRIALQNLFDNAWKYSRNEPFTRIEFGSFEKDEKMIFFLKDNGVGFDMKYSHKLFGAFQRLHSATEFEGTGIGLTTVQRIIHRHQGIIWAESEVNNGAVFYFTL